MDDASQHLRQRIGKLRPDWDLAGVSGLLYLEGGYSNDNYLFTYQGERYVLRAPFRTRADVDRALEQRVYDGVTAGLTPEVVAFDAESGHMISRWVAGTLLADGHGTSDALTTYLVRLHRQLPVVDAPYDPLAHAQRHLAQADAPPWVDRLAARLHWAPETVVTCHNDLNPWNVIRTPAGAWITLDWEWVGRNDPLFDLVTLHQGAGLADAELDMMARGYLGHDAPQGRLVRCLTVFWLRETAWAMAEIAAGNARPEVVAQRDLGLERLTALRGAA